MGLETVLAVFGYQILFTVILYSGGLSIGGEVAAVTLARVVVRPLVGNRTARVLPRFCGFYSNASQALIKWTQ